MTAERPYRARLSVEQALAVLRKNAGTQFDPGVVAVVCAAIADRGLLWDGARRRGAMDAVTARTQGAPIVEELSA
jgi:HD-GYP domain-containing protein (c-di-GMP phosphodiesterase class II)